VAGVKKKTGKRPAGGPAPAPARALPDPRGDAPLDALSRDALSVLLYLALLPEEARAIVKDLGLAVPGFRTEALSDVELCDVLADEIRAAPATRARVIEKLRAAFGGMPLPDVPLDEAGADDLLAVGSSEHGLTFALWRVLADPDAAVRARATPVLERLLKEYYGPAPAGARPREKKADPAERIPVLEAKLAELAKSAERERADAEARLSSARKKAEEQREKLQAWLKEARAREAQAVEEAARAREAAEGAQRARERAEARLAEVQATDAAAEAQRARALVRELEGKLAAAEVRLARQEERGRAVEAELEAARARPAADRAVAPAPAAPPPADAAEEPEEATWLRPVFTREFYDSLEGWDRRIQRAAFKQANLLAQDHRHPSLRALPLEGLPGYYRVRVATDVRLLYRRGERQNAIEILSLIDREDLDRYVRQAKTRSS
jgi:mRNA-degrading endonuclease RelE of RelBE toxin-antitoxin system